MKKIVLLIVGGMVVFAVYYIGQGFTDAMVHGESSSSFDNRLANMAKEMNAGLPRPLNSEVRLEAIDAGPGNRLTYLCTLVNLSSSNLDHAVWSAKVKPGLVEAYKARPAMEVLRSRKVELHYHFRDKDGNDLDTIVISPKDF